MSRECSAECDANAATTPEPLSVSGVFADGVWSDRSAALLRKELEAQQERLALKSEEEVGYEDSDAVRQESLYWDDEIGATAIEYEDSLDEYKAAKEEVERWHEKREKRSRVCKRLKRHSENLRMQKDVLTQACDLVRKEREAKSRLAEAVKKESEALKREEQAHVQWKKMDAKLESLRNNPRCKEVKGEALKLEEMRYQVDAKIKKCNDLIPGLLADATMDLLLRCSQGPSGRSAWELWRLVCRVLVLYWDLEGFADEETRLMFASTIVEELRRRLPARISDSEYGFFPCMAELLVLTLYRRSFLFERVDAHIERLCNNRYSFFSPDYIWTVPPLRVRDLVTENPAYPGLTPQETKTVEDYTVAWTGVLKQIRHKLECEGHDLLCSTEAAKLLTVRAPAYAKTIEWSERLLFELRFLFPDLWRKQFACWDAAAVKLMWIVWINADGQKDPKRQFMSDEDKADIAEFSRYSEESRQSDRSSDSFSASRVWLTVDVLMNSGVRNGLSLASVLTLSAATEMGHALQSYRICS